MQQTTSHILINSFLKSSFLRRLVIASSFIATTSSSLLAQEPDFSPIKEKSSLTEVVFLPTIHGRHLKSKTYSLARLEAAVRDIKPEIICSEIVPASLEKFDAGKKDRRLSAFPEYIKVILPLREELKYEVIPCSAYSKEINFRTVGTKKMSKSHSENIAKALDKVTGQGKKVLVTFGGGHISNLIKNLKSRKDISIIDYRPILDKSQ